MTIDEEMLVAYADDELDELTRARVERAVAESPALRVRLELHRNLRTRITAHYGPVTDEPVPAHLAALLRPEKPEATVIPFPARAKSSRIPAWSGFAAVAASLAVGMVAGQMVLPGNKNVAEHRGILVARGPLADALDEQLASNQAGASIRIGISFRNTAGEFCRTYNTQALSGIACKGELGWQLPVTKSAQTRSVGKTYRQAGSADEWIMTAAAGMMRGEPLDALEEKTAREKHWQ